MSEKLKNTVYCLLTTPCGLVQVDVLLKSSDAIIRADGIFHFGGGSSFWNVSTNIPEVTASHLRAEYFLAQTLFAAINQLVVMNRSAESLQVSSFLQTEIGI
jgi:hypothetical protein